MITGIPASDGICIGKAIVLKANQKLDLVKIIIMDSNKEIERLHAAIKQAMDEISDIKMMSCAKFGKENSEIFEAHIMMLEDPEFYESVEAKINESSFCAEYALKETIDELYQMFKAMDNEYMQQRASDITDIGNRVMSKLTGNTENIMDTIDENCIIVANDLTPSDTATMNFEKVIGFATDIGGRTSHSAIMARTIEIPAIVGLLDATSQIKTGDNLILDGNKGLVFINPDQEKINEYIKLAEDAENTKAELLKYINIKARTIDGKDIEIGCNIGNTSDVKGALKYNADGIGLFRTEFLYMDSESMPDEEQQFISYRKVAESMGSKPVIIRTLDIGGDKNLPYLEFPHESNPFLGYRAIRMCLDKKDILKTQISAILRASAFGIIRIMLPMVSVYEEFIKAKEIIKAVKFELDQKGIAYDKKIQVGIMIETPSAALISDILAKESDFFSIGTNDLIQYTIAIDRTNEKVAHLYSHFNPSVLRLIGLVVENAHKQGIFVGICGEMGGDPKLTPVLAGLGIDELSMSAASISKVKKVICNITQNGANQLAQEVLALGSSQEIQARVEQYLERIDYNK